MKNQVTLIGYVGSEPETRAYPSGDLVTSISLATSEKWRDRQSNELKEHNGMASGRFSRSWWI